MLAVVLAILAKLVVILKTGLRKISKRVASLIYLSIYTPPQHALTHCCFYYYYHYYYYCVSLSSIIFIVPGTNYRHLLLT